MDKESYEKEIKIVKEMIGEMRKNKVIISGKEYYQPSGRFKELLGDWNNIAGTQPPTDTTGAKAPNLWEQKKGKSTSDSVV